MTDKSDLSADIKKMSNTETIRIKYHTEEVHKLDEFDNNGDWIDLRSAEDVTLKKGESRIISLGISVQLPEGYEMIIAPRSSTFKKYGIIQTNSIGIVDSSYNGDNDIIGMPVLAMRDTKINVNERICQFRIQKNQPRIVFDEVESLGNKDRGGFGSTGY